MTYVEYHSNNSGGGWWMKDEDWFALEKAGWVVRWSKTDDFQSKYVEPDGRYMGALAVYAIKQNTTLAEAIAEFDRVTSCYSADLGCNCCGTPHSFTLYNDDGKYIEYWSPSFPTSGDSYYD